MGGKERRESLHNDLLTMDIIKEWIVDQSCWRFLDGEDEFDFTSKLSLLF